MSPCLGFRIVGEYPPFCSFTRRRCHSIRYLLRYWELRVGNYLPTAISLLEDMKAAYSPAFFHQQRGRGLLQFRVLRLGFLQDGDVGVSVFPEGEEPLN